MSRALRAPFMPRQVAELSQVLSHRQSVFLLIGITQRLRPWRPLGIDCSTHVNITYPQEPAIVQGVDAGMSSSTTSPQQGCPSILLHPLRNWDIALSANSARLKRNDLENCTEGRSCQWWSQNKRTLAHQNAGPTPHSSLLPCKQMRVQTGR